LNYTENNKSFYCRTLYVEDDLFTYDRVLNYSLFSETP